MRDYYGKIPHSRPMHQAFGMPYSEPIHRYGMMAPPLTAPNASKTVASAAPSQARNVDSSKTDEIKAKLRAWHSRVKTNKQPEISSGHAVVTRAPGITAVAAAAVSEASGVRRRGQGESESHTGGGAEPMNKLGNVVKSGFKAEGGVSIGFETSVKPTEHSIIKSQPDFSGPLSLTEILKRKKTEAMKKQQKVQQVKSGVIKTKISTKAVTAESPKPKSASEVSAHPVSPQFLSQKVLFQSPSKHDISKSATLPLKSTVDSIMQQNNVLFLGDAKKQEYAEVLQISSDNESTQQENSKKEAVSAEVLPKAPTNYLGSPDISREVNDEITTEIPTVTSKNLEEANYEAYSEKHEVLLDSEIVKNPNSSPTIESDMKYVVLPKVGEEIIAKQTSYKEETNEDDNGSSDILDNELSLLQPLDNTADRRDGENSLLQNINFEIENLVNNNLEEQVELMTELDSEEVLTGSNTVENIDDGNQIVDKQTVLHEISDQQFLLNNDSVKSLENEINSDKSLLVNVSATTERKSSPSSMTFLEKSFDELAPASKKARTIANISDEFQPAQKEDDEYKSNNLETQLKKQNLETLDVFSLDNGLIYTSILPMLQNGENSKIDNYSTESVPSGLTSLFDPKIIQNLESELPGDIYKKLKTYFYRNTPIEDQIDIAKECLNNAKEYLVDCALSLITISDDITSEDYQILSSCFSNYELSKIKTPLHPIWSKCISMMQNEEEKTKIAAASEVASLADLSKYGANLEQLVLDHITKEPI